MTSTHLEKRPGSILPEAIEKVLISGDLAVLNADQRNQYYKAICDSVGLNPLTKPFDYITLNGKLVLYATKNCTDQLRSIHKISIQITSRDRVGDVFIVTARARGADGREDESTGAVSIGRATGDALANLYMKAETKAKRRVTLSIVGLGLLDESEVETIPSARKQAEEPVARIQERSEDKIYEHAAPVQMEDIDHSQVQGEMAEAALDQMESDMLEQIETSPAERVIEYGKKYKGKKFKEFKIDVIKGYVEWMRKEGHDKSPAAQRFLRDAEAYILDDIPF